MNYNLTITGKDIKKYLDENQIDIFCVDEMKSVFPESGNLEFKNALRKIINLEYSKIERGKYCRNTFRNEYVIGNYLISDAVVAYWSALNIHGLTEQFPNKVYIQTSKKKQNTTVFGVNYCFVKVRPDKMTGIGKTGIGTNQFRITDTEKTIVDCFDLPNYSGGFMELIRAFNKTALNSTKMISYSELIDNRATIKRMGYLAETLNKSGFKQFVNYAKKQRSKNYDLFDVYGQKEGKYNTEWRLILNIEKNDLLGIANSIY